MDEKDSDFGCTRCRDEPRNVWASGNIAVLGCQNRDFNSGRK